METVKKAGYQVNTFIPNAQPFNNILWLVGEGASPRSAPATGGRPPVASAAPAASPPQTPPLLLPALPPVPPAPDLAPAPVTGAKP